MSSLLSKIISFLRPKDELCGSWHTEDGSGFSMLMGSWIKFGPGGTGTYESWSTSNDDTGYHFKGIFEWKRTGSHQIEIGSGPDKELLDYKLEKINNRIELTNRYPTKTGSVTVAGFWNFAQVVFKER